MSTTRRTGHDLNIPQPVPRTIIDDFASRSSTRPPDSLMQAGNHLLRRQLCCLPLIPLGFRPTLCWNEMPSTHQRGYCPRRFTRTTATCSGIYYCFQGYCISDLNLLFTYFTQVNDEKLNECVRMVSSIMAPYDGYAQSNPSHRQRLTWKLSRRTLKQLRPTEKLVSVLPTIEENRQFGVQKRSRRSRLSPHKMRPVSPGAVLSSLPLPFPTKEDLTSFFDNFVAASPYSFRFLYGLEEESPSTAWMRLIPAIVCKNSSSLNSSLQLFRCLLFIFLEVFSQKKNVQLPCRYTVDK